MLRLLLFLLKQGLKSSRLSEHPTKHHIDSFINDIMLIRQENQEVTITVKTLVRHMAIQGIGYKSKEDSGVYNI